MITVEGPLSQVFTVVPTLPGPLYMLGNQFARVLQSQPPAPGARALQENASLLQGSYHRDHTLSLGPR